MENNKSVSRAVYDGIVNIIQKYIKTSNLAVVTDVLVTSNNNDGTYAIKYLGKIYNIPLYGNNTITVNKTAKMIIPGNNLSRAFII